MKQYTLKVYPNGMGRTTYRVIEFPGTYTLDDLCSTIMQAFDFIHEHMYEFCMDNRMYSENSYQYRPEPGYPSTDIKLDKISLEKGQKFSLHYDYGDDWMFTINVQKIEEVNGKITPSVIKSKGDVEQYPSWVDDEEWEDED